ncbi:hypothetical protein ABZW30_12370 [Kitasatospora sp. NPDC004669]|uniref:hypothetical protein n=1 Tax=Kitasatospora sp. NPDC004669 TaxID=3154555 RepID=UPI0033BB1B5B
MATPNPNWPLVEEAWGPYWQPYGGLISANRWSEITSRVRGTVSQNRGRQYELDQVRAGELRFSLDATDGVFDPSNAASPFAGRVLPMIPVRRRAQWPPTINRLSQGQATGGDVGGWPLGSLDFTSTQVASDTGTGSVATDATAYRGGRVLQFPVPSTATAGQRIVQTSEPAGEAGATYTVQMRVRNVTPGTTVQVKAHVGWYLTPAGAATAYAYGATTTLTGSATAAWTQITCTATLPANALAINVGASVAAAPAATVTVQVDEWQLEKNASASAWVQPGTWYPLYGGFIERWPQSWTDPKYALVNPVATDTFAAFSQLTLQGAFGQEVTARGLRFMYTLSDPQGSTVAADATGQCPPAIVTNSASGSASLTFGTQITSASAGGAYTGAPGTVCTITGQYPGSGLQGGLTYLSLSQGSVTGPANPAEWIRMIAFRWTGGAISPAANIWVCQDGNTNPSANSHTTLYLDSSGHLNLTVASPTTNAGTFAAYPATNLADGNWHLVVFGYSASSSYVVLSVDGSPNAFPAAPSTAAPTGLISDVIGGYVDPRLGNTAYYAWQGDLSYATEFQSSVAASIDSPALTTMYNAWKNALAGESTDSRYNRVLYWAGYNGGKSVQTGRTTAMGPAAAGTVLQLLQDIVTTEGGAHYVDRAGNVVFKSRADRYNATTSAYTFGDGPGELPYEPGFGTDFDLTRVANIVTAAQPGGQPFTARDSTSINQYFPHTATRTINSQSALEVQDAANYLLSRYRQPATRVTSLTLNPAANPALWPVCLSLELGMRVTVNRRRADGSLISLACFVENIQTDMARDTARWVLQLSPVDTTPYGLFASFHTSLNGSPAAGVTSITINAGADNTNPAAAQLGQGQQLVLGLGTANQETVTVQSVGTTTAGWTTAVITLTAATVSAHTAGDTVCEPLPAGVTDPTTWDNVAKFDAAAFSY